MTIDPDVTLWSEQVEESEPVEFQAGLIGLSEWKQFVVMQHPQSGPLCLLQSLDEARFSLIVADPKQFVPDYQLSLSEADAQALQLPAGKPQSWPAEVKVGSYCILSVQEEPLEVTANLLGPLVINWQARLGRQIILSNSGYEPRYPITGELTAGSPVPQTGKEQE